MYVMGIHSACFGGDPSQGLVVGMTRGWSLVFGYGFNSLDWLVVKCFQV